jgi:hypothetical protein
MTASWYVAVCSLALVMKAVSTSEMSANFYETTQCIIQEDNHLQKRFKFSLSLKRFFPFKKFLAGDPIKNVLKGL